MILFCLGSRLVVSLAWFPATEAWLAAAERIGVRLRPSTDVPRAVPESMRFAASVEVAPDAPIPNAARLAELGELDLEVDLEVEQTYGAHLQIDDAGPLEREHLQRARWLVHISLAPTDGDLLPTLLAVALAGAARGHVHHAGLDRSVFGLDAAAMMALLVWHCDHTGEPTFDDLVDRYPSACVGILGERVTELAFRYTDVTLETAPLLRLLTDLTLQHHERIASAGPEEWNQTWEALYLTHVHLWLQEQLRGESGLEADAWGELMSAIHEAFVEVREAYDETDEDEDDDVEVESGPASLKLARELLGIEHDASPLSVKRAYLRQVKKHRPERDPEGFQRVRAAYERLRADDGEVPAGSPIRVSKRQDDAPTRTLLQRAAAPPAPTDPAAPFFERARKLRRGDPGAIDIWREAVSAVPDSRLVRSELYAALMACEREDEAAESLLDAIRAGVDGFERLLVMGHGEVAPDDVLERAAEADELRPRVLEAWVRRQDWHQAGEVARRELERALADPGVRVSIEDCIRSLLGLAKVGAKPEAVELARIIERYVTHAPKELHGSGMSAHWVLAFELAESLSWLKPDVRKALAIALLTEDVAAGRGDLAALLRERPKERTHIVERAPLMAALFEVSAPPRRVAARRAERSDEAPPSVAAGAARSGVGWFGIAGIAAVLLTMLAVFARREKPQPTYASQGDYYTPRPLDTANTDADARERQDAGDAGVAALEAAAKKVIAHARETHQIEVVALADELLQAARAQDCDTVRDKATKILLAQPVDSPKIDLRLSELSLDLFNQVKAVCF